MNVTILSGRLASDVKFRLTMNGRSVSNFSLAVSRSFKKDKNGKYSADFFDVTAWDALAERCRDYLTKGRSISLSGHLLQDDYTSNKYTDADGKPAKIHSYKIVAHQVEFLGYRKQYSDGTPKEDNEISSPDVGTPPLDEMAFPDYTSDLPDEEIPF